ncbi:hypothetical protein AURDEDRAFT_79671 [Auricularia subglabra TFB-10046 SS5]|nr:hypothetical protein AURDEDRAFT_79671 [Auricularia subglabra TFB-10046 SS5]
MAAPATSSWGSTESSTTYGALPPRSSIVMLPPVDSSQAVLRDYDSSIAPEYRPAQLGEPDQAARDAQRASEAREQKLEDEAQMRLHVTTRFRYERDNDGNHLVLGHAGNITRCEDEPIRIPGAVQAFGVLLALRKSEHSSFEVRQVSENSTQILGLSPTYLFHLECFTDTLPEDQAGRLHQSLEFLSDLPFDEADPEDQTPQLLELSGFGEPGSALPGDAPDELGRRLWHCACALHRAPQPSSANGGPSRQPLLVLELELCDDTINPMCPQPSPPISSSTSSAQSWPGNSPGDYRLVSSSESAVATPQVATDSTSGRRPRLKSVPSDKVPTSPSVDDIRQSTTMFSSPIREIERLRAASGGQQIRFNYTAGAPSWPLHAGVPTPDPQSATGGSRRDFRQSLKTKSPRDTSVDMISVMNRCNDQLTAALDLESLLNIVVGLVKYLTGFHRVLVYQFDDEWNGQTVAEFVDRTKSKDIFRGLHFPASDIPKQARDLYAINKVRSLYDRDQPTARLVCKSEEDLKTPLDMTHSFLRAMSPIHLKYLANMQVRGSMSISIMGFEKLWGLIACHSYGEEGMRVSFHMRHMLRLFADSVSRNLERLSFTQRLQARKLLNAMPATQIPSGYMMSNAEDLLTLFEADYGILIVGDGAKIMGENVCGQELLIVAEYLRLKRYPHMFATKCLGKDYPDLYLPSGPDVIAGMLYVPLTPDGRNFIAFLRKTHVQYLHWAGPPAKKQNESGMALNPRDSFATWTQRVYGRCRAWVDEQMDTAAVLALVYGKFIEVWREKQPAAEVSDMTQLLLSNASHEVRTPLNQIIGFLELALAAPLGEKSRKNLIRTHQASKSLLFTINDLLDLTRLETGQETSFKEPFDLPTAILDATKIYEKEAARHNVSFTVDTTTSPSMVWGDAKKIRTVVANVTANAVKYTTEGSITVTCRVFKEPGEQRAPGQVVVSVSVEDTGYGIPEDKLGSLFRQIEQYQNPADNADNSDRKTSPLGLGLAVVARIVQQLGGQLRVESKVNEGSTFKFLLPFLLYEPGQTYEQARLASAGEQLSDARSTSGRSQPSASYAPPTAQQQIAGIMEILGSSSPKSASSMTLPRHDAREDFRSGASRSNGPQDGEYHLSGDNIPIQGVKIEDLAKDGRPPGFIGREGRSADGAKKRGEVSARRGAVPGPVAGKLRVMVVDDDRLNRKVLSKRLERDGHVVVQCGDGVDAVDLLLKGDLAFDCIFMDIQMPLMNGLDATKRIREIEHEEPAKSPPSGPSSTLSRALARRIPVVAVSASLLERERDVLVEFGIDGWLLKPVNYRRVGDLIRGIHDQHQRARDVYTPGCSWEGGGWLRHASGSPVELVPAVDAEDCSTKG